MCHDRMSFISSFKDHLLTLNIQNSSIFDRALCFPRVAELRPVRPVRINGELNAKLVTDVLQHGELME